MLDFCAGAGGKTLAFGPFMKVAAADQNLGQIYVHDIRQSALTEAKKRINRSGMTNVQFHNDEKTLVKMAGKMDWVVLDVPCSGTRA